MSYGRTDNVTCLAPNQAIPTCNASIDLRWRVWPYCQGKSSCVINGSYDDTVSPCDGNRTNYFNISYNCKKRKLETLIVTVRRVEGWHEHKKKRRTHNCKETKLICYFVARNHGQDLQMALNKPWVSQNVRRISRGFAVSFFIARLRK